MRFRHLSDEQALELALGEKGAAEIQAHLEKCAFCRERVQQANEGWRLAINADLPEPSPLYWEALKRRIGRKIVADKSRLQQRRWLTLAVVATAILMTIAVLTPVFVSLSRDQRADVLVEAWSALPNSDQDPALPILEGMFEADAEQSNGCHLGTCALDLSDEEIRNVSELLREEMGRSLL